MGLFKAYVASLPAATVPPALTDTLIIKQGADLYQIQMSDIINSTFTKFFLDASVTPSLDIKDYTDVLVVKTDAGAGTITVTDSSGKAVNFDPISQQGESLSLSVYEGIWYRN